MVLSRLGLLGIAAFIKFAFVGLVKYNYTQSVVRDISISYCEPVIA